MVDVIKTGKISAEAKINDFVPVTLYLPTKFIGGEVVMPIIVQRTIRHQNLILHFNPLFETKHQSRFCKNKKLTFVPLQLLTAMNHHRSLELRKRREL